MIQLLSALPDQIAKKWLRLHISYYIERSTLVIWYEDVEFLNTWIIIVIPVSGSIFCASLCGKFAKSSGEKTRKNCKWKKNDECYILTGNLWIKCGIFSMNRWSQTKRNINILFRMNFQFDRLKTHLTHTHYAISINRLNKSDAIEK